MIQASLLIINEHGPDKTWTWNEDQQQHETKEYHIPRLSAVIVDLITSVDPLSCITKENRIIFQNLRQLPHPLDKMKTPGNTDTPTHPANMTSMVK